MDVAPPSPQGHDDATRIEAPSPEIDLSVYVMPAFATLQVHDLEASRRWYVEGPGSANG